MPPEKAKKGEESKKLRLKKKRKLREKLRKGEKSVRTSTEADPPEPIEECERTQDFTVSSAYQAADWNTDDNACDDLQAVSSVDLENAVFLPYPMVRIVADVLPYPREQLEAARTQLLHDLQCSSPLLNRVKVKCGILPDGRRFAIRPPSPTCQSRPQGLQSQHPSATVSSASQHCWPLPAAQREPLPASAAYSEVEEPILVEPCPPVAGEPRLGASTSTEPHPCRTLETTADGVSMPPPWTSSFPGCSRNVRGSRRERFLALQRSFRGRRGFRRYRGFRGHRVWNRYSDEFRTKASPLMCSDPDFRGDESLGNPGSKSEGAAGTDEVKLVPKAVECSHLTQSHCQSGPVPSKQTSRSRSLQFSFSLKKDGEGKTQTETGEKTGSFAKAPQSVSSKFSFSLSSSF